jgi:hypothetical protein
MHREGLRSRARYTAVRYLRSQRNYLYLSSIAQKFAAKRRVLKMPHNLKVAGSNPAPATIISPKNKDVFFGSRRRRIRPTPESSLSQQIEAKLVVAYGRGAYDERVSLLWRLCFSVLSTSVLFETLWLLPN